MTEVALIRDVVRAFCERESREADVRRAISSEHGYEPHVWRSVSGSLGLTGAAIPESHGGSDLQVADLAAIFEELGAALVAAPLLGTTLAAIAITRYGGAAAKKQYLPGVASGETRITLVTGENSDPITLQADGLYGSATVFDAGAADLIIVPAAQHTHATLFAVATSVPEVHLQQLDSLDGTRRVAKLTLSAAQGHRLDQGNTADVTADPLEIGRICLAAECLGGMRSLLRLSVTHAKERIQFGQPIGTFQAIKHRCADMYVDYEVSASLLAQAVASASDSTADTTAIQLATSAAKAQCAEAYRRMAESTIQIHGGIGFTWEHPAHLYYRRAVANQALLGSPTWHRQRIATLLGMDAGKVEPARVSPR